jgi:penicillin G amidase
MDCRMNDRLTKLRDRIHGDAVALGVLARILRAPRPRAVGVRERLAALPHHLPVEAPVTIHWNEQQIPFIEAESDADLAVALGAVHAHLRLTQMELLRRLSQGRIAELVGPLGIELDRALRLFDFGRAVPGIIAALAPETRSWAEGFLRGVNTVIAHAPLPPDMEMLGMGREPWTLTDLFTAARLAGADVTWIVWARLLRTHASLSDEAWRALWPRLLAGGAPEPEAGMEEEAAVFARIGSNAAALAGWRSASGSALLAADPHLSIALPNVWLTCAFRSFGFQVAGLMPAGFPIVAIGRNPDLAWAGTSLHAAGSDLFDAATLPMHERRETIRVRGAADRELVLRETPLGPVVSDGFLLGFPRPLALRWVGHGVSDEMGAMLGVMRARTPEAFRAALAPFAIPGQNMIFATREGRVGHLLATRVPRRQSGSPPDIFLAPDAAAWERPVGTAELPFWFDPPSGVVASANDRPPTTDAPVGFFFSPAARVTRLRELLGGSGMLGLDAMAAAQRDVTVRGVLRVRDALLARLGSTRPRAARALADWDGSYTVASRGALLFEVTMAELAHRLRHRLAPVAAVWTSRELTTEDVLATPDAELRPALLRALRTATRAERRFGGWGGMHRLRLRHHLGAFPLLGRRFRFGDTPSPGSNDTLDKTGHGPARGRHGVSYGASARFLADMAEDDANRVVLLGGEDGWLGSASFVDQVKLWREGRYVPLPLRPEAARAWPFHTVFTPG